jgi:hypothetical protein
MAHEARVNTQSVDAAGIVFPCDTVFGRRIRGIPLQAAREGQNPDDSDSNYLFVKQLTDSNLPHTCEVQ